jgi:hypothetical protein
MSLMARRLGFSVLTALACAILASVQPYAGEDSGSAGAPAPLAGRTPVPTPARGRGDKCVAPTDWMRRNHMTMLKHQRDDTVHLGERTGKFSLKACVECHAVNGKDGHPLPVSDPGHFCRSCHDYAAVSIDCFECHASRPPEGGKAAALPVSPAEVAKMQRYVEGLKP